MKHNIISILSEGYLTGWREKRERGGGDYALINASIQGFCTETGYIVITGELWVTGIRFLSQVSSVFVAHPEKSDIERCVRAIFKHITKKSSKVLKEMGCSEPT